MGVKPRHRRHSALRGQRPTSMLPGCTMLSRMKSPGIGLALVFAAALAACGDPNLLPPATEPIRQDTLVLWALTGTPILRPSAFDILRQTPARTDRTSEFDFAFDFRPDSLGDTVAVLIPRGWFGLSGDAGLLRLAANFDTLRLAPAEGYEFRKPVVFDTEVVVVVRSRPQTCNFGLQYGLYMKLQMIDFNRAEGWVRLRMNLDPNCGYRGLAPGIPSD